jgi:hypothetical protein
MDRDQLLARFRTGYTDVEEAVAGLTDAALPWRSLGTPSFDAALTTNREGR